MIHEGRCETIPTRLRREETVTHQKTDVIRLLKKRGVIFHITLNDVDYVYFCPLRFVKISRLAA